MAGPNEVQKPNEGPQKPEAVDADAGKRTDVKKMAADEKGLQGAPLPEQLSSRPKVKVNSNEKDVSDSLSDDTKIRIYSMASKNMDPNGPEYKNNDNLGWNKATFTTMLDPQDSKPIMSVLVKGNSGETITQGFKLGSWDIDKNIAFQAPFDSSPPFSDNDRDNLNKVFRA